MEDDDLNSNMSHKISQTVFPIYNPNSSNMSLVNSRIYSPLPGFTLKTHSMTPKKIKNYFPGPKRHILEPNSFRLPGFAAGVKELISPFSIKTTDFSKLYSHYTPTNCHYINLPSVKPRYMLIKPPRRLQAIKTPQMIGSKKQLTVRKMKKIMDNETIYNNLN